MDIFVDNLWNDFITQTVFMYLTFSTYNKYAVDDIETVNKGGSVLKKKLLILPNCHNVFKCHLLNELASGKALKWNI